MLKRPLFALMLISIVSSMACSTRLGKPRVPDTLNRTLAKVNYDVNTFEIDYGAYKVSVAGGKLEDARRQRDAMISRIRVDVEMNYREFEAALFAGRATGDSIADFLELGIGLATTISNGARVKTVLSAVSTSFKGDRLSIDKNFFREKTIDIVISKMQAFRGQVKNRITENMLKYTVEGYPFEDAWADLVEFFYAGTLQGGIQALAVDAGKAVADTRKETQELDLLRIATPEQLIQADQVRTRFNELYREWSAAKSDPNAAEKSAAAVAAARKILQSLDPSVPDSLPAKEVFQKLDAAMRKALDDKSGLTKLNQAFKLQ